MPGASYAYAVGRIRVLENTLLSRELLDRMIAAPSAQDVMRLLGETAYNEKAAEIAGPHDYEKMLVQSLEETYRVMLETAPDPEIINLFLYRHDFHNLKALSKGRYSRQTADHLLVDWGVFPVEKLRQAVDSGNYRDLPPQAALALKEIDQLFLEGEEPQAIDLLLDKAYYRLVFDYLNEHSLPFLRGYFTARVDLTNLRSYLRVRNAPSVPMKKVLLPYGSLPAEFFHVESNDNPAERPGLGSYRPLLEQALEAGEQEAASALERLADDYLLDYVRRQKGNPFGIEPLIGFLLAKEQEILALRIILVGKINGISPQVLRKRVRTPYV